VGKSHQIQIGDRIFSSKTEAEDAVKDVLRRLSPGDDLESEDLRFVSDLLALHPRVEEKTGPGVERISIRTSEYGRKGFLIHRLDGTILDFSYKKCIRPPSHRDYVIKALRQAVASQTIAFADATFSKDAILICPLKSVEINRRGCHVDHDPPFWKLVESFLSCPFDDDLAFDKIAVARRPGVSSAVDLVDRELHARWAAWHAEHAKLRVVSVVGNLEKGRSLSHGG
jgi:hypothetical protein